MSQLSTPTSPFRLGPMAPLCLYGALLLACAATIDSTLENLAATRERTDAARAQLARLEARNAAAAIAATPAGVDEIPAGAAFVPGDKVSAASAELQRRVSEIVARAGGSVLSSLVERQPGDGPVAGLSMSIDCDIDQTGLRRMLYDIEASAPFLFIDAMTIKARTDPAESAADPRLRVSLRVGANWKAREP